MNRTSLFIAAAEGHVNIVKMLLEKGANPNVVDKFGYTLLESAQSDEIFDLLCSYGANESHDTRNNVCEPLLSFLSLLTTLFVFFLTEILSVNVDCFCNGSNNLG